MSLNEVLDVLTINGAKQLGIEKERGSIEIGKYADFIRIDQDITKVDKNKIHDVNITNVYFEGNLVYTKE